MTHTVTIASLTLVAMSAGLPATAGAQTQDCPYVPAVELISETQSGAPATGRSQNPVMSYDGRFVAFNSKETDLGPSDTNGWEDVFVHDRLLDTIERISVAHDGGETDERSYTANITPDGLFVAFASQATNIIPDDTNDSQDIFLKDMTTGTVERVSIAFDGAEANGNSIGIAMTPDARFIAFSADATNLTRDDANGEIRDVFVRDRVLQTTERVNAGIVLGPSLQTPFGLDITPDGRYVTFVTSYALVPGDPTQIQHFQGYVHDRDTGITERVTTNSEGVDNAAAAGTLGCRDISISDDGRYVAFECNGDNLVPYDTYGSDDVFIKDRVTGLTERISVTDVGAALSRSAYRGRISDDGRFVAFLSTAAEYGAPGVGTPPPMAIVLHDRLAGMTKPILIQEVSPQFVGFSSSDFSITPFARYAAYGAPLSSTQGAPPKDVFFQDRGEPVAEVLSLEVTCDDQTAEVSAQVKSPPVLITEPAAMHSAPAFQPLGAELNTVRMVFRPELDDVFVRIGVRSLELAKALDEAADPDAILYRLTFLLDGVEHRAEVERAVGPGAPAPTFTLFSCPGGTCTETATLEGGFGTSGEAIRFAIPRGALPAGAQAVTGVVVTTSSVDAGEETLLDQIVSPDGTLPGTAVEIGIAGASVPEAEVPFAAATLDDCLFTASFASVPAGAYRVWTRVCDETSCAVEFVECGSAVGVEQAAGAPAVVSLAQNTPNPFRGSTVIRLQLAEPGSVRLTVFNAAGRSVRTLVDGHMQAGVTDLTWDGLDDAGRSAAAGVYYVRLEAPGVRASRKMLRLP